MCVIMKIHGLLWRDLLLVTMFMTFLALCISLPISQTNDNTLGESIFGLLENQKERREKSNKRVIGRYYGSCPELKEDIKKFGKENFKREILSLHETKGKTNFEETKQLFLNEVLSQSLTDGTPAYYNSNILGRYFRKDYFDYDV